MAELPGVFGRTLYTAALWAAAPLAGPVLLARGLARGKYLRVLPERLGYRAQGKPLPEGALWIHGVSAGEILAARTLLRGLRQGGSPPLVLSSTTASGLALARVARNAGEADATIAAPLDFPGSVRAAFDRVRPRALILVEAELWPNWVAEAARREVPVVLVNARVRERSARNYARFGFLFRPLFASLAAVAARSDDDLSRVVALGAARARVSVTGELKFDAEPPRWSRSEARQQLRLPAASPVFAAGSVLDQEMGAVLGAFRALRARRPDAVLLLAPRKSMTVPAEAAGLTVTRRSRKVATPPGGVLLLDTMGELRDAYAAADVAFVGGSLVVAGGHNVLEPAAAGVPVLFGPWVENFTVPATRLLAAGGAVQVGGAESLAQELLRLAEDPAERAEVGRRALEVVEAGRGALARTIELVRGVLAR